MCCGLMRWRYVRERSCLLWVQPQLQSHVSSAAHHNEGILRAPGNPKCPHAKSFGHATTTYILLHICLSSAVPKSPCEFPLKVIHGFPKIVVVGSLRAKCQVAIRDYCRVVGNWEVTFWLSVIQAPRQKETLNGIH